MPRRKRVLVENACYHVISRGNRKQIVFNDDEDYQNYLHLLRRYKRKFPTKLYAYCLMNNHVHMVFDPDNASNLTRLMRGINTSYAIWYNDKYEKSGHLWQDRFKSLVILKDRYLIDCLTYVENNPIRAEIVLRADEYPWSSYKSRVLGEKNRLVDTIRFY